MGKFKDLIDIKKLGLFKDQLDAIFATKVDKVQGKGLSTEDYTTAEKEKLAGIDDVINSNAYKGNLLNEFADDFPTGSPSYNYSIEWDDLEDGTKRARVSMFNVDLADGIRHPLWPKHQQGVTPPDRPDIIQPDRTYEVRFSTENTAVKLYIEKNGVATTYTSDTSFTLDSDDTFEIGLQVGPATIATATAFYVTISIPEIKTAAELDGDLIEAIAGVNNFGGDLLRKFVDFPSSYGGVVSMTWTDYPLYENGLNVRTNRAFITNSAPYAVTVPLWAADDIIGANAGGASDPGFPDILDTGVNYRVQFSRLGGDVSLVLSRNGTDSEYVKDTEFVLYEDDTWGIGLKIPANSSGTVLVSMPDPKSNADLDEDIHGITVAMDGKVDKVNGKGLSTEDYTTAEKTKLGNLQSTDVAYTYNPEIIHLPDTVGNSLDTLNSDMTDIKAIKGNLLPKFATFPTDAGSNVAISWNVAKTVATVTITNGDGTTYADLWESGIPDILEDGRNYKMQFESSDQNVVQLYIKKDSYGETRTNGTFDFSVGSGLSSLQLALKVTASGSYAPITVKIALIDTKTIADLDADIHDITVDIDGKVDKVNGKGLSTEDYTTAEKTKLGNLQSTDVSYSYNSEIIHTPGTVGSSLDTLNTDVTSLKQIKGNLLPKFGTFPTDAGSAVAISWNSANNVATVTITNGSGTTYADLWSTGLPDLLEKNRTYRIEFESSDTNVVQLYVKKNTSGTTYTRSIDLSIGDSITTLQIALKVNANGSYAPITAKIALVDTKTIADLDEDIQGKLDINQGSGNAGKAMVVGSDGILVPANATVELDSTLTQQGKAADAKAAGDKIAGLTAEMTLAQYNNLSQAQKMDGTIRFITDVSVLPSAEGVGF